MSYETKWKAWAIEVVSRLQGTGNKVDIDAAIEDAKKLYSYVYEAEEDINELRNRIAEFDAHNEYVEALKLKPASSKLEAV